MSNSDGVLAAIDACLEDYDVGPDAMRWAPDGLDLTAETTVPNTDLPEWQYVIVGADPAVVEVRRYGQPWGAYLLNSFPDGPREYMERTVAEHGEETAFYVDEDGCLLGIEAVGALPGTVIATTKETL
ncbi:hypothetical protein OG884_05935 [Streptosporangium sp. NBC_01755]|uniref:hypothetical protein n=1 Tax=Streptosporangium sp. NBC_01755 TaxID=2975949 RepID=UPI002DD7E698|nr:hypothetical protein [Streptosporangium sp. NBC_01755]WSD01466.1 hypothetical protein OG884_05935 [Streptosporangium sp. NBC_01755]